MTLRPDLFAARVRAIGSPATVAVSNRMREMQRAGIDVVEFAGGDPDFPTPMHIVDAAYEAMRAGDTHYVASRGIPELRDALAAKLLRDNGLRYDPAREILVTPSGKHALFCATMALLDAGDEAIILDPSWVTYEACVRLAGATPVSVPLTVDDNFRITPDKLERAASPRTKLLIVNSPNNPTGRVLDGDELQAVAAFAQEHNLVVVADEMYEKIMYDGRQHVSLATLPGMRERTLTLNGFSKAYAMTGWRLGYIAGPADMIGEMLKVHEQSVSCATSFVQRGGL
ncbi:MAG: pyridoxal phosphate-dependent aminotransferase, partial [Chloroflexi bacterium]|nr:pyridoxal phosphate-dependent aminotransferase [Chloroflexota bacterium]